VNIGAPNPFVRSDAIVTFFRLRGLTFLILLLLHMTKKIRRRKIKKPHNEKSRQGSAPAGQIIADSSISGLRDVGGLGTFRALNDLKFNGISLLQGTVTFTDDGGIMYKNVWSVIAPDEPVPLGIIEPLHSSLHLTWPPEANFEMSHPDAGQ
jgi:hypothetical protein